jgi:hypothetical protein
MIMTFLVVLILAFSVVATPAADATASTVSTTTATVPNSPDLAVFPVRYSADGRYLVDQNNVPFPIMGRTSWFITALGDADYHTYITDTAAKGFSAIEFHVVNHDSRGHTPPFDGNGNLPFINRLNGTTWDGSISYSNINSEAPDFTTPNEY